MVFVIVFVKDVAKIIHSSAEIQENVIFSSSAHTFLTNGHRNLFTSPPQKTQLPKVLLDINRKGVKPRKDTQLLADLIHGAQHKVEGAGIVC